MNVTTTGYTIAEYCDQMLKQSIVVNHDYQRSPDIWPAAARSYLIDTILHGYPIPKIALFQKTNVKSRKTIKEIVDGQQRSMAIYEFFNNKLRITGKSDFAGKKFDDLEIAQKQAFIEYQLSADLFVGATEANIRQMFRRMNSYTVPLNPEEQRHAHHQGAFKWFIVQITETHESALSDMGVFGAKALARMQDSKLFTELVLALQNGIETYDKEKLDDLYERNDHTFDGQKELKRTLDGAVDAMLAIGCVHNTSLAKPFNAYSMLLALIHLERPNAKLRAALSVKAAKRAPLARVEQHLDVIRTVADAEEEKDVAKKYVALFQACNGATNTKNHRETRFEWMYRALTDQM